MEKFLEGRVGVLLFEGNPLYDYEYEDETRVLSADKRDSNKLHPGVSQLRRAIAHRIAVSDEIGRYRNKESHTSVNDSDP